MLKIFNLKLINLYKEDYLGFIKKIAARSL